jgi:hypothetical protein
MLAGAADLSADLSEDAQCLNRLLEDMTSAENQATFDACLRMVPEDIDASSSLRILCPLESCGRHRGLGFYFLPRVAGQFEQIARCTFPI